MPVEPVVVILPPTITPYYTVFIDILLEIPTYVNGNPHVMPVVSSKF